MDTAQHRHDAILDRLSREGRAGVTELADLLGVAAMTIRRDLALLERAGVLTRTHGGCVPKSPYVEEIPFSEKDRRRKAQKLGIAAKVASLLEPGSALYLDTGTTAVHVAQCLPRERRYRVFTNNLRAAMELFGRPAVEVVVFGGILGGKSPDLSGSLALAEVQNFQFDVAVAGADALDVETASCFAADTATAILSRTAQERAGHVIFAVDSSKFGKRGLALAGRLGPQSTLVTDSAAAGGDVKKLRGTGARVFLANSAAGAGRRS